MNPTVLFPLIIIMTGITIGVLASPMSRSVTVPTMVTGITMILIGAAVLAVTQMVYVSGSLLYIGVTVFAIGFVGAWHQARKEQGYSND